MILDLVIILCIYTKTQITKEKNNDYIRILNICAPKEATE